MKVVELQGAFGLDHLRVAEREKPTAGIGRVVVKMKAASLNYRDLMTVKGLYNPKQPLPLIPCSDGVGEVVAVGPGVSRLAIGQRVVPLFAQAWQAGPLTREAMRSTLGGPIDGTLAAYREFAEDGLVPAPAYLSDVEAATLPCAALTAWSALVNFGEIKPGDVVLVQGTGGVALFALQISKLLGARVIVTSSSEAKLARVRDMGAWQTINYRETTQWGKAAKQLTDGVGVDHVIEVGGAGTLEQSLIAVRPGGTISVIGVLTGVASSLNIAPVLMNNVKLQGVFVGNRQGFEDMCRAFSVHELRPVVDKVFGFAESREALSYMESARHFGKVCIAINS